MKKKNDTKPKITIFDRNLNETVVLDSNEEYYVYAWIMQCFDLKVVKEYAYQPESFLLTERFTYIPVSDSPKKKEKFLMASHSYTPDFKIVFDRKYLNILSLFFKFPSDCVRSSDGSLVSYIDVKGGFNRFGGDRTFSINQKMMYDKYHIYVQKTTLEDLFSKLGIPNEARYTIKTKKPLKKFSGCEMVDNMFKTEWVI